MNSDTVTQLKKLSQPKTFSETEYICSEGQPGSEMYIILKGSVGVYITGVLGTLNQVATINAGDFFGEMAIFDNLPRSASCIALEDTIAVAITKDNLQEFVTTCPDITKQILENMSGRIRKLNAELYHNNRFVKNRHVPKFEIPYQYTMGHMLKSPFQSPQFVNEYKQKCPICGKVISVVDLKRNVLEEKNFGLDCRIVYVGCDPLWTEVISCPHCYYSNHYLKFFGINNFEYELVKDLLYKQHRPIVELRLDKRGDYDNMAIKYLQAININEHINPGDHALIGSLWRNLYWLSKDASDIKFASFCAQKAVEKYKLTMEKNEFRDIESKAATALSLANMMLFCDEDKKEVKYYVEIAEESPNERIRTIAQLIMARLKKALGKAN